MVTVPSAREPTVRPLSASMRRYLVAGSVLALIAGAQVYVTTGHTDRYFAWTIRSHLTAAFLGAMYWGAVALLALSARSRVWAAARIGAIGAEVLMPLLFATMLLHFDVLHTHSPDFIPSATAWAFLVAYAGLPLVFVPVLFEQLRLAGEDPPRLARVPVWMLAALGVYGGALVGIGGALFAAPHDASEIWPWALTTIGGRAVGSFLIATGVVMALGVRERDWERIEAMVLGLGFLAVLQLVALARYGDEVDWSQPAAWVYLLAVVGMLALALYGAWRLRAADRPPQTVRLRSASSRG
jgi:hypothetical protein